MYTLLAKLQSLKHTVQCAQYEHLLMSHVYHVTVMCILSQYMCVFIYTTCIASSLLLCLGPTQAPIDNKCR